MAQGIGLPPPPGHPSLQHEDPDPEPRHQCKGFAKAFNVSLIVSLCVCKTASVRTHPLPNYCEIIVNACYASASWLMLHRPKHTCNYWLSPLVPPKNKTRSSRLLNFKDFAPILLIGINAKILDLIFAFFTKNSRLSK